MTKIINAAVVSEVADKFLIPEDDLYHVPSEVYVEKKRLNHGPLFERYSQYKVCHAYPWGLDGLSLITVYDRDNKVGYYVIRPRFRLYGGIVATYLSYKNFNDEEQNQPNITLHLESFIADSEDQFLRIIQDSINTSTIQINPDLNRYDLTFRGRKYRVTLDVDEKGCYASFATWKLGDSLVGNWIVVRPVSYDICEPSTVECAVTINRKTVRCLFALEKAEEV